MNITIELTPGTPEHNGKCPHCNGPQYLIPITHKNTPLPPLTHCPQCRHKKER